jgi:YbbR domain-containing protein
MPIKQLEKMIFENWVAKLGALLISIALWLAATNERRSTITRGLEIPLEIRGITENRVIKDLPKTIALKIQGARGELEQIQSSNLEASINIGSRPDGFFSSDVRIDAPSNIKVLSYEPRRISATLKSVIRESILVKIAPLDNANPTPSSYTVLAVGTSEQVSQVVFALGVAGSNQTELTPVDSTGKLVEGVRLEPSSVELR